MMNFLLGSATLLFTVSLFGRSYVLMSLNKAYLGLYKGIAESSLICFSERGDLLDEPYFDVGAFQSKTREYLREAIPFSFPFVVLNFKSWNAEGESDIDRPCTVAVNMRLDGSTIASFDKTAVFTAWRQ